MPTPSKQDPRLRLFAAGSLKTALAEIIHTFHQTEGIAADLETGPSGVLRERIEAGEKVDLFLSANPDHPRKLLDAGAAVQVIPFTRNQVCLYGYIDPPPDLDGLIDLLLDPSLRLGTSTPGDDPGGDYAFQVFKQVESVQPGTYQQLRAKALQLVGGRNSAPPPEGKHAVQHLFEQGSIDLFLGYYTSALFVKSRLESIRIQKLPQVVRVETVCALAKLAACQPAAARFIDLLLSETGKSIFNQHGFKATQ